MGLSAAVIFRSLSFTRIFHSFSLDLPVYHPAVDAAHSTACNELIRLKRTHTHTSKYLTTAYNLEPSHRLGGKYYTSLI